jgi:hypothetical protein
LAFDRYRGRSELETVVAGIVEKQISVSIGVRSNTWVYYSISLQSGDVEFTCNVESAELIRRWNDLEAGTVYEFVLNRKGGRCYIQSAIEIEGDFQFLGEGD